MKIFSSLLITSGLIFSLQAMKCDNPTICRNIQRIYNLTKTLAAEELQHMEKTLTTANNELILSQCADECEAEKVALQMREFAAQAAIPHFSCIATLPPSSHKVISEGMLHAQLIIDLDTLDIKNNTQL